MYIGCCFFGAHSSDSVLITIMIPCLFSERCKEDSMYRRCLIMFSGVAGIEREEEAEC